MAKKQQKLPERCSIEQALLWIRDRKPPIENEEYFKAPDATATYDPHSEAVLVRALREGRVESVGMLQVTLAPRNMPQMATEDAVVKGYIESFERGPLDIYREAWHPSRVLKATDENKARIFSLYNLDEYDVIDNYGSVMDKMFVEDIMDGLYDYGYGFTDIDVNTSSLMDAFQTDEVKTTSRITGQKRGPKPKHEWGDPFWIEIVVIADSVDGLPDTQEELVRQMMNWFGEEFGQMPDPSDIRRRITKIYNHPNKRQL